LVSYIKRRKQIEIFCEQGGEENILFVREEGTEGYRRFCSELHDCYSSLNINTVGGKSGI